MNAAVTAVAEANEPETFEALLERELDHLLPSGEAPPQFLHRALRHAVFGGGQRLRPQLLLHVAAACGLNDSERELAVRAACAVELIHAASLVHDDLPCFDDAAERRGRPTVHVLFGEPAAVLVGDALLTLAFEVLADAPDRWAPRAMRLVRLLGRATGTSAGIIGGQSLELDPQSDAHSPELIERYHAMKTGALFRFAAEAGAIVAGSTAPGEWARIGERVGLWYQLADDFLDVRGSAAALGKPVARDATLGRPNAVCAEGEAAIGARMRALHADIRAGVRRLAPAPDPLLALVDAMHHRVQRAIGAAR